MLRYETIEPATLELLRGLMKEPLLANTRLVGGTALALQLGHRSSIDLDMSGHISCDDIELRKILASHGELQLINTSTNVKLFTINGVKVDIVNYDSPWIDEMIVEDGLRLASVQEIAAMKVRAIVGRGTRKDFVDLYFLLQQFSMSDILNLFHKKYPDVNDFIAIRSLTYFEDAEQAPMPFMHTSDLWDAMKAYIKKSVMEIL